MNTQSYSWQQEFINCLELGTTNVRLGDYFENIIALMRDSADPKSPLNRLVETHSSVWVQLRYEEFLDRLFVSELAASSAFPVDLPVENAKMRFRQLIRVFHPDRGAHEEAWLNYRAERINQTYKDYQVKKAKRPSSIEVNLSEKKIATPPPPTNKVNSTIKYKPNALRERFGNADVVQRRIVLGLCLGASILVLLVFLSSSDPINSASKKQDGNVSEGVKTGVDVIESENLLEPPIREVEEVKEILAEAPWLDEENTDFEITDSDVPELDNFADSRSSNFSSFDTNLDEAVTLSKTSRLSVDRESVSELGQNTGSGYVSSKGEKSVQSLSPQSVSSTKITSKPKVEIAKETKLSKPVSLKNQSDKKVEIAKSVQNKKLNNSSRNQSKWSSSQSKSCDISIGEKLPLNSVRMKVLVNSNIRQRPNVACNILSNVLMDEEVEVLQRVLQKDGQWFNIVLSRNGVASKGWIYGELLEVVEDKVEVVASKEIVSEPILTDSINSGEQVNDENIRENEENIEDAVNVQLKQVLGVLDNLQSAYEAGDVGLLAALYTSRGRENFIIGNGGLKRFYKWQFPRTYARKIQFNIDSHNFVSDTEVRLKGTAFTSYKFVKNDKSKVRTASAKFILVKVGDAFKIKSFDWKKI